MEIKNLLICYNDKEFKYKSKHNQNINYECKHRKKLNCKASLVFDSYLNEYKLLSCHNKKCSNIFSTFVQKNETLDDLKINRSIYDSHKINTTELLPGESFSSLDDKNNFQKMKILIDNEKISIEKEKIKIENYKNHVEKILDEIKMRQMVDNINKDSLSSIYNSHFSKNSSLNDISIMSNFQVDEKEDSFCKKFDQNYSDYKKYKLKLGYNAKNYFENSNTIDLESEFVSDTHKSNESYKSFLAKTIDKAKFLNQ